MRRFAIICTGKEARFYASEGWNNEILRSCLWTGNIEECVNRQTKEQYWRISQRDEVSAFDVTRLLDFTSEIIGFEGNPIPPEKQVFFLQVYAQVGVFDHGDRTKF